MELSPSQQLHAILLSEGGEVSKRELIFSWGFSEKMLHHAIEDLTQSLENSVELIIENEKSILLSLRAGASEYVRKFKKEAEGREIGNAQAEVLSCVLYRGPISKAEIDDLRGVDSRSSIRELRRRGYIEENKKKQFIATVEALRDLGIQSPADLPDYETISRELQQGGGDKEA